ncbi:GNAT family N-acetyltransferase, partial [Nonomuraea rubra]|uniref:GNAT family N-acetyltransferase n=1 Tax=Nonomuraea rubra TaxID=46180 RepID=UPI003605C4CA
MLAGVAQVPLLHLDARAAAAHVRQALRQEQGHSLVAGHDGQVVGMASLMFTNDPGTAELAFLVEDRWQGRGLGTAMARMLVRAARDLGYAEVRATMLADNTRMRRLL